MEHSRSGSSDGTTREDIASPILLLDYDGAAKALSMSRAALRDLVYKGRGPRAVRIGRRMFFALKDLEEFVDQHREGVPVPTRETPVPPRRKRGRPTIAEQMERRNDLRP
ncbi:MAG: helix-turn-helix domain-containing protein [Hyphomicrobiales bacterium]|nr:helix-turn-helix domain-containing protein [Hyphomicrobiales bacterium]